MKKSNKNSPTNNSADPATIGAKQTDVELAGLSGPVRQVKQICYKAHRRSNSIVKGKVEVSVDRNYSIFYNEKGNKTEEQFFGTGGWSTKKIYNKQGLPVEESSCHLNGDLMNKTTKKYDALGHLLENIQYDNIGNITMKILAKYDDYPSLKNAAEPFRPENIAGQGNKIEECVYNAGGLLTCKQTWLYDDKGHLHEMCTYDANDLTIKCEWHYDDKDNMTEVTQYNAGVLTSRTTNEYKYDKQGNKLGYIAHFYHISGTSTTKSVFRCNERGDIIEAKHYDAEGNLTGSHSFTPEYDEQGYKINPYEEMPEEKLESETEECENDSHGNWIKKTTYYTASSITWKKIPVHQYIREITYWGEKSAGEQSVEDFFAEIKSQCDQEFEEEDTGKNLASELSDGQRQWMAEASTVNDPFPLLRYYVLTNEEMPSFLIYAGPYIEALALLNELRDNLDAQIIHSYSTIWNQQEEMLIRYILSFPGRPGYLLRAGQISSEDADEFEIPGFFTDRYDYYDDDEVVYFSQIEIFRPSDDSGRCDEYSDDYEFENELKDYISKCTLRKKPDKPTINMIETTANGFVMKEHAVDDDFEIKDLDVNYGYGFSEFHNELMQRFNTSTKGLVLFHGEPGTGKTYYIRHLLRKMTTGNKVVIYMPPNMVDHLVEPVFMTFLSNEIQAWAAEGNFCVLLIEDAEPLLARRQEGVRIQGITNLLNMSDGILNDMLNLQIICTFNVDLKRLDNALLRPGRLIARKEFKKLSELDANVLAQRLGIKHHFTAPATLGEIYAMLKNKNTLIHDVTPDKDASTIIDDL
jgi:hypothetical protein